MSDTIGMLIRNEHQQFNVEGKIVDDAENMLKMVFNVISEWI